MSELDPYIKALVVHKYEVLPVSQSYCRRDEIISELSSVANDMVSAYNGNGLSDINHFCEKFLDELVESDVFILDSPRFAGTYYKFNPRVWSGFRNSFAASDGISLTASRIGARFYSDVFVGFRGEQDEDAPLPQLGIAPASSRIVSFDDNQIREFDEQASTLIDRVEEQNQLGSAGLRELIVGQLKAGRELIRAGSARLYLIELTLLESLKFLAQRYERETIGALAAVLLTALAKHLGLPC